MTKDWKKQSFQQSKANLFAAMQYHTEEEVGRVVLQLLRADERCDDLEDFVRGINMRLLIDLQKGAKAIPVEAVPAINMEQESLRLEAERRLRAIQQAPRPSTAYLISLEKAVEFLLKNCLPEEVEARALRAAVEHAFNQGLAADRAERDKSSIAAAQKAVDSIHSESVKGGLALVAPGSRMICVHCKKDLGSVEQWASATILHSCEAAPKPKLIDEVCRSLHCESCGEWLAQGTKAELEATASAFLTAHQCKGR